MLLIRIELIPGGDVRRIATLGSLTIANDRTGTPDRGNYAINLIGTDGHVLRTGLVKGHDRRLSPWHLVRSALDAAGIG